MPSDWIKISSVIENVYEYISHVHNCFSEHWSSVHTFSTQQSVSLLQVLYYISGEQNLAIRVTYFLSSFCIRWKKERNRYWMENMKNDKGKTSYCSVSWRSTKKISTKWPTHTFHFTKKYNRKKSDAISLTHQMNGKQQLTLIISQFETSRRDENLISTDINHD